MAYDYGYGELENKLIDIFRAGAPDFSAAEELLKQGANLNAAGKSEDDNILSEILTAYWWTETGDSEYEICENCENRHCDGCEYNRNPKLGQSMCEIIHFFLNHGFDVTKNDGCYGAQCLSGLTLSSLDRYMIEATKILFDAGAINRTTSPHADHYSETPWDSVGTEGSFQDTCEHNHHLGNIYESIYQVYQAKEDGRSYSGIDSYELAIGKKIQKVLAKPGGSNEVFFPLNLPEFKRDHCFNSTLYFVYENGALITTQYADFWTDTVLPDNLIDVSEFFKGIVDSRIQKITFDHDSIVKGTTHYGQPITNIQMDSGCKIIFSINFGQVEDEYRAAFWEIAPLA